jgi:hypothetical protein
MHEKVEEVPPRVHDRSIHKKVEEVPPRLYCKECISFKDFQIPRAFKKYEKAIRS